MLRYFFFARGQFFIHVYPFSTHLEQLFVLSDASSVLSLPDAILKFRFFGSFSSVSFFELSSADNVLFSETDFRRSMSDFIPFTTPVDFRSEILFWFAKFMFCDESSCLEVDSWKNKKDLDFVYIEYM